MDCIVFSLESSTGSATGCAPLFRHYAKRGRRRESGPTRLVHPAQQCGLSLPLNREGLPDMTDDARPAIHDTVAAHRF
jgi:hypothetical protein